MANLEEIKKYKHVHMLGIGGVSMSGIAEILNHSGVTVTGSDSNDSEIIQKLQNNGIFVTIGHDLENLSKSDLVVYSAAISQDDIELVEAKKLNIPTMERADFIGKITADFSDTIAVSGTHGKTTTTSMISVCFLKALLDPTIQVGAVLKQIDGNYKVGNSNYFILEACEYVESFLKFTPKTAVFLNIDNDHLDYFKTFDNIKSAFVKFIKLLPQNGLAVLNGDDTNCLELQEFTNCNIITYGINNKQANFTAKNISFDDNGFPSFDVYYNNELYSNIKLSVAGSHNILNALACISVCYHYNISIEVIKSALLDFTGANRRLEYKGTFNNVTVFDDYGHHPTEILAMYEALKNKKYNESWVIFQPHTYSRTKNLLDDFANSLADFDNIIITDIYAAREKNIYNISSKDLVNQINSLGKKAMYISDFSSIVEHVKANAKPKDIVLTLGAGTVTNIGPMLVN